MSHYAPSGGPRVVIIGLGVVGASLADELVLRGWQNITVVDQGPLYETGGSSSHAPGFVFQTGPDKALTELAQRTLDKLDGAEVGGQWVMKRVGGIELATTEQRLQELHRRYGFAQSWGVPAELISPEEVARLWPGLDTSEVLGGLHTPTDAVVKGVRAVEFQARRAVAGGARILANTKVTGIRRSADKVTGVEILPVGAAAEPELLEADVVVCCTGLWGPGLARELLGLEIPMLPVEHGFGFSQPVEEVTSLDEATEVARPMLRHQGHGMYFREWGNRIAIGAYEHQPLPVEHHQITSPEEARRSGVQASIHPFTRADYESTWEEVQKLIPALRGSSLDEQKSFNGIFSFTPDGGPLLGPVSATEGLWMAQAVWVTQSAGVGQVMAEWIVNGDPGIGTHSLNLNRFDPILTSKQWSREQGEESYDEVYDIVHPKSSTLRMRGLRTSPFYERQRGKGAAFSVANGWERPLWYQSNMTLPDGTPAVPMLGEHPLPPRDRWAAQHWNPVVAVEAQRLRESVGLVDMSALPRLQLSGPGATEFLTQLAEQGALSRPVGKKVGTIVYALMLNDNGGILSDVTIARTGEDAYHLGVNGNQDAAWLQQKMRELGYRLSLTDASSGSCGIGIWGPAARKVLATLVEEDISHEAFGFYRCRELSIAGVPVLAMRLSYVGELGWELYAPAEFGRYLWDELMTAGKGEHILPVGRRAFESLRLEKGFRLWGADMTAEHTPAEAGLEFAVRGAAAQKLTELGADTPTRRLVCLTLEDSARVLMGHEPVYAEGGSEPIGYITSADQGYTIGASIAYAWVPNENAQVGTTLEVAYFGERSRASVSQEPLFDPTASRMRS
ncbi:FAD-dependent oxidoreductase [Nesterenkonia sp. MY13]|uniref:FAD-dependent oxidoreductase n=1 Tax=Nesterenkonia sedimenti TaxID=1463632 RepID=A0A7X8THT8_9MICC|nr:FAD-dependent oxidoreductase [Nesterenkonia sedimenti]NLS08990.1 FAD-dependent oxidoreductase [Nesterenkonia sedimenti]